MTWCPPILVDTSCTTALKGKRCGEIRAYAFSKLKAMLRKHAARSFDAITTALGEIVSFFSVTKCQNFFKAAGYEAE
jgi:hypothetical protein